MDKELFADLMQSMKEAVAISKGEEAPQGVKQVREKTVRPQNLWVKKGLMLSEPRPA